MLLSFIASSGGNQTPELRVTTPLFYLCTPQLQAHAKKCVVIPIGEFYNETLEPYSYKFSQTFSHQYLAWSALLVE